MHNHKNTKIQPPYLINSGHGYVLVVLLILALFVIHASSLKIGETCSKDACDDGLMCSSCPANANTRPRCVRTKPIIPTTKVKGLPFNKYSWLTTHNSFAMSPDRKSGLGSILLTSTNQEDSIAEQLTNGVRGLMLDMYDFENGIWLCHSFRGACLNVTSFEPAKTALREVADFLQGNPTEIVTIFVEDYVKSPNALTKLFDDSGLNKYKYPLSEIPKNGQDWPTVDEMVKKNHRLIIFTSVKWKESSEAIAYEWNYVVENQYGNEGMKPNNCTKCWRSTTMDDRSRSLVLMNYFRTNAEESDACSDNSINLMNMTVTCFEASGKRWPNFIAVDFYKRSDGGGASAAVDKANGHLTCGCDSIAYCRENAKFGVCDVPLFAPPPPAQLPELAPAAVESLRTPSVGSHISKPLHSQWFTMTLSSFFLFPSLLFPGI